MKRLPLLMLLLLALPAHAEWFITWGQAPVIDGETDAAREQAIEDALRQAMLQAGASVSSIQSLHNGKLAHDRFQIRSNSEIRQYTLLEERRNAEKIQVRVRAYVVAEQSRCSGGLYAKSISLIRFRVTNPDQASYGQLSDLHRELTRQLFNRLAGQRQNFVTQTWLDANLGLDPSRQSPGDSRDSGQLQALATQTDSQYLVFGQIDDLAVRDAQGNVLTAWLRDPIRQFGLRIYLFDGLTGELVDQGHYQTQAPWSFAADALVDVHSQSFWQSAWGQEVSRQLDRVALDLQGKLQCSKPTARIIRVEGDKYHINLGKRYGIKVGDRFYIEQKANYQDDNGRERIVRQPTLRSMEVKQVFEDNAIMSPGGGYAPANIQRGDLAVLE